MKNPKAIWITGLSGAGKTTLANLLRVRLEEVRCRTVLLDGDDLRRGLSSDLTFSREDRKEQARRAAQMAALLLDQGFFVVIALISPFRGDREIAKHLIGKTRFIEVYLNAPLSWCIAHDTKGIYTRHSQVRQTTYEESKSPDVVVYSETERPENAAMRVMSFLFD